VTAWGATPPTPAMVFPHFSIRFSERQEPANIRAPSGTTTENDAGRCWGPFEMRSNCCATTQILGFGAGLVIAAISIGTRPQRAFHHQSGALGRYLGPNGAGNATPIKILSGILASSLGCCEIQGMTPWRNRTQPLANIGVVFGQRIQLRWDPAVVESFERQHDSDRIDQSNFRGMRDQLVRIRAVEY